tara:strand:- start:13137 stop:13334 length:198 start_codon:yes stop_codon:yes gene_type:complete
MKNPITITILCIALVVLSSCSASVNKKENTPSLVECTYNTPQGEYTTELPLVVIQKYGQNTNKKK